MISAAEYEAQVAAAMTEAVLQARALAAARQLGWLAYHTHDSRRSDPGFPDLVLVHARQARILYRELKTAKGRLRPAQATWLKVLTAAGADAAIWRPADLLSGRIVSELRGTVAP